jgi:hypothetical protein
MQITNNPAGRLLEILERALKFAKKTEHGPFPTNAEGWAFMLLMHGSSALELHRAVLEVAQLARKTRSLIEITAQQPEFYLKGYENIEFFATPGNWEGNFREAVKLITSELMVHLKFGAMVLTDDYSEAAVESEELVLLLKQADELFEFTVKSSIANPLRSYILESIELIRRSISMHRIHGAASIKDALKLTLVGMIEHADEIKQAKDKDSEILGKFGAYTKAVDQIVSVATKSKELIGYVAQSLPSM